MDEARYRAVKSAYADRFGEMPPSDLTQERAEELMALALKRGTAITSADIAPDPKAPTDLGWTYVWSL